MKILHIFAFNMLQHLYILKLSSPPFTLSVFFFFFLALQRWKTGSCSSAWCRRSATRTTSGSCSLRSDRSRSAGSSEGPTDWAEVCVSLRLTSSHAKRSSCEYSDHDGLQLLLLFTVSRLELTILKEVFTLSLFDKCGLVEDGFWANGCVSEYKQLFTLKTLFSVFVSKKKEGIYCQFFLTSKYFAISSSFSCFQPLFSSHRATGRFSRAADVKRFCLP